MVNKIAVTNLADEIVVGPRNASGTLTLPAGAVVHLGRNFPVTVVDKDATTYVVREVSIIPASKQTFQTIQTGAPSVSGNVVEIVESAVDIPLENAQAQARTTVNNKRVGILVQNVLAPFPGGDAPVQVRDDRDIQNINGVATAALAAVLASSGTTFKFRDANDVTHTLTAAEAITMASTVLSKLTAVYDHSWTLKDDIENAADLTALRAIDLETGWPDPGA